MKRHIAFAYLMSLVACDNTIPSPPPQETHVQEVASQGFGGWGGEGGSEQIVFLIDEADPIPKQDITPGLGISLDKHVCEPTPLVCEDTKELVCVAE